MRLVEDVAPSAVDHRVLQVILWFFWLRPLVGIFIFNLLIVHFQLNIFGWYCLLLVWPGPNFLKLTLKLVENRHLGAQTLLIWRLLSLKVTLCSLDNLGILPCLSGWLMRWLSLFDLNVTSTIRNKSLLSFFLHLQGTLLFYNWRLVRLITWGGV